MFKTKNFHVIMTILLLSSSRQVRNEENENGTCKLSEFPKLPDGCQIDTIHGLYDIFATEFVYTQDSTGIVCNVKSQSTRFDRFGGNLAKEFDKSACFLNQHVSNKFDLRFPPSMKFKLNENLNLRGIVDFQSSIWYKFSLHLTNVGGFDANLSIEIPEKTDIYYELIKANVDFYANGKEVESCQDLLITFGPTWSPNSILQGQSYDNGLTVVTFFSCRFKKPLCPLLFKNARLTRINIWGMSDFFYKHNSLSFTNDTFRDDHLNSSVREIFFYRCENLAFDSKLLNLEVFKHVDMIFTNEPLKLIENELFARFDSLTYLHIRALYFRKLAHKQGIEWARSKNRNLRVNLNDPNDLQRHQDKIFHVVLKFFWGSSFSHVFPDADFCLYKDFPFTQLVVFVFFKNNLEQTLNNSKNSLTPTCTSRWIARYYREIQGYLKYNLMLHTKLTIEAESMMQNRCDFEKLLDNCNKHKFHSKYIWDMSDTKLFTKYIQVIFAISLPIISLAGIFINSLLVYMILNKNNSDLFKGLKQYPHLCALAVFNLMTLSIQLVAWLSECNKTYDVFCPNTRRLVFFQFFKIIFKETLVVTLRFMSNFAYMGFAFNRVALVGKNHAKIVEKLSKWKFRNYMLIAGISSVVLSFVKVFKYQVNYGRADHSYPFSIEEDLTTGGWIARDIYFGVNLISDFLNYVVFVLINLSIDIYMLRRLRQILNEKLKRFTLLLDINQLEKELKMSESMNNAIRMVVVNSVLNLMFKLPQTLIPLENVVERFYYESRYFNCNNTSNCNFGFMIFSQNLRDSRVYYLISDFSDWLLTIFISIQLIVYSKFDRNIKIGLDRFFDFSNKFQKDNENNNIN